MTILKKILIIDDERDFCKLIVMMLEREHYHVYCAFTLKEAAQLLDMEHPEIVLLDQNLPDGTGLDFLINSHETFDDAHVIFITADPSRHLQQKVLDAGVQFLAKPFELREIRDMIRQAA
jgi:DNA-binding response OmpR family regulator